jgi:hypothetical protein
MSNGSGSNPCSHPQNHILGDPPMTIAPSSMVCYGSSALEPLGGIFRSVMVPGGRWPAASTAGRRRVSSAESLMRSSSRPMAMASSTGPFTMSTAPSSERISTQLGQKRGS